jgi:hypothetical protein
MTRKEEEEEKKKKEEKKKNKKKKKMKKNKKKKVRKVVNNKFSTRRNTRSCHVTERVRGERGGRHSGPTSYYYIDKIGNRNDNNDNGTSNINNIYNSGCPRMSADVR